MTRALEPRRAGCSHDGRSSTTTFVYLQPRQYLGELGATIVVRRTDEATIDQLRAWSHARRDPPGPGRPEQAGVSLDDQGVGPRMPLLGVCLGHQAVTRIRRRVLRAPMPVHGKTRRSNTTKACRGPGRIVSSRPPSLARGRRRRHCLRISRHGATGRRPS